MLGSFKDERYVYIVMECVGGGELFTHLRRARKFTDEQSKFYGAQTGAAFEHIHSKNIVHRDLKPENILLSADGYSKLTDFGFAKVVDPRHPDLRDDCRTACFLRRGTDGHLPKDLGGQ